MTEFLRRRARFAALLLSFAVSSAPAHAAARVTARDCSPQAPMDVRAQCVLGTPAGKRALATVGEAAPADLEGKRAHAALTPSFARYVIKTAGVDRARPALEAATADAYARHTGRTLAEWRADWVEAIGAASAAG
jgi:hypothetical protein